jgi:hypothetical protein
MRGRQQLVNNQRGSIEKIYNLNEIQVMTGIEVKTNIKIAGNAELDLTIDEINFLLNPVAKNSDPKFPNVRGDKKQSLKVREIKMTYPTKIKKVHDYWIRFGKV